MKPLLNDPTLTTSHIEDVAPDLPLNIDNDTIPTTAAAAAVIPSTSNPNNEGLTPDTDESAYDVSPSAFPHIIWHAAAFGQREFPDIIPCLLDTGTNLILIV